MAEPGERLVSEVIKNICLTDSREVRQKGPFVQKIICHWGWATAMSGKLVGQKEGHLPLPLRTVKQKM